ncbi:MAG: type II toxin-antitoxin system MqsA family antitoxin [Elusimicrobia bacterium]|nr:type II toxin-antitoxin system MqsA family antitoxin [Candidatus Obscuribacterium magneticum]MCB4756347.1 type II toxin-antitoxin system MqsA family antitoxin [Candidatus Obscuribacterium magneticum]
MKCVICKKGETEPGKATITLERNGMTLVFKNVPANICSNCGEQYVDDKISGNLLKTAEDAAEAGVEVDIREYKAA